MNINAIELGKIGGSICSKAKSSSSKINGLLGGRPVKTPILLDTGAIKGCNYIYAPKGQALEYSELAANPYRGCGHKCAYCYVPKILRMKNRSEFDNNAFERPNYLKLLTNDARKYQSLKINTQVMLSFTTDVYHPFDTSLTRKVIEVIQEYGMSVCTLTKGGSRALRDIDLFRPGIDVFATTLTSVDDAFSLKWESGAAVASDRMETLKKFHNKGIYTWVSLEPTLSADESLRIVRETHEFVDLYKVGRINYSPITKTIDWKDYTHRMIYLLNALGKNHYIKHDLQKYLPDNYHNPLRAPQIKH